MNDGGHLHGSPERLTRLRSLFGGGGGGGSGRGDLGHDTNSMLHVRGGTNQMQRVSYQEPLRKGCVDSYLASLARADGYTDGRWAYQHLLRWRVGGGRREL